MSHNETNYEQNFRNSLAFMRSAFVCQYIIRTNSLHGKWPTNCMCQVLFFLVARSCQRENVTPFTSFPAFTVQTVNLSAQFKPVILQYCCIVRVIRDCRTGPYCRTHNYRTVFIFGSTVVGRFLFFFMWFSDSPYFLYVIDERLLVASLYIVVFIVVWRHNLSNVV